MASSLSDILRQREVAQQNDDEKNPLVRGPDGNLQTQPIQSLAGQVGLPSAPTSPLQTAIIGGNANQQKMAGTAQQKQAAITQSITPGQSLQDTLRTQQVRTQTTGAEQQEMQKSKDMQDLGGLGDRVTDFINAQRSKLEASAQAAAQGSGGVAVEAAGSFTGGASGQTQDLAPLKDILKQLRQDPTNMDLQLQVNQALGSDINTQLSPDQINQLYEDSISSLSRGGANVVDDKLSVDDLVNLPKFGYDINSLSNLLGVPPDQLKQLSVGQLKEAISAEQQKEMSNAATLGQKAQSTLLGSAERAEARGAAAETSQTGIRATEQDVQKLVQSISNADLVQFGGQSYRVDDLLKDDTISGIITDYMNAAPGSTQRAQLEKSEPGLIDFIKKNQAVLQDAATKLSGGAGQFQDIQTANRGVGTFGGQQLNKDLLTAIVPNFGKLQASKIDQAQIPLLAAISHTNDPTQATLSLNTGIAQDKSVVDQVQQLNQGQLNNLLVSNNGQQMTMYINDIKKYNQNQSRDKGSVANNMSVAFGMPVDQGQFQSFAKQNQLAINFGMNGSQELAKYAGMGNDQFNGILNQFIDSQGKPSLANAANGQDQGYKTMKLPPLQGPSLNPDDRDIYNKLSTNFGAAGRLSVDALPGAGLSMRQVASLVSRGAPVLGDKASAQAQLTDMQNKYARTDLKDVGQTTSLKGITTNVIDALNSGGINNLHYEEDATNKVNEYNDLISKYTGMKADPEQSAKYGANLDTILGRLNNEKNGIQSAIDKYWDIRQHTDERSKSYNSHS